MLLVIERREQCPLGGAVVDFNIDNIYLDIPLAEGSLLKAAVGRMVDLEDEDGNEFGKQPPRRLRKFRATLGQPEFALEVAPQAQGDQKLVQHLERREFEFIDDLVVVEHFFRS